MGARIRMARMTDPQKLLFSSWNWNTPCDTHCEDEAQMMHASKAEGLLGRSCTWVAWAMTLVHGKKRHIVHMEHGGGLAQHQDDSPSDVKEGHRHHSMMEPPV